MTDPASTHEHEEVLEPLPPPPTVSGGRLAVIGGVVLLGLGGLFVMGLLPRLHRDTAAREQAAGLSRPRVSVARPRRPNAPGELALPGTVTALQETVVNARVPGYVKKRLVDIGDKVKEGQLLLEIETPELDHELAQARSAAQEKLAALEQAKSNLALAKTNVARFRTLTPAGVTSQSDLDQREASVHVEEANVKAVEAAIQSARANVSRIADMKTYARVVAPFAGTVTSRSVEVGQLVNAGSGGLGLLRVAQVAPLRVFVAVPQTYASGVRVGDSAAMSIREIPGRTFTGKITRTAGALDSSSRSLLTEVQVPNDDGVLLPGMFATVKMRAAGGAPPLLVPSSALLVTAEGTKVAVLTADSRVSMRAVVIDSDYGLDVGVVSGVTVDDDVITNPGERIAEGVVVERAAAPAAASSAK
jgi:RND family efflux transporter MFP subunit